MSVLQNILFILFFIGLVFVIIDVTKNYNKCPPNKTVYRFIPRTFKEEQENPVPVEDLFTKMFNQPEPWIYSFDIAEKKQSD
jgi:hypothetical protein